MQKKGDTGYPEIVEVGRGWKQLGGWELFKG